MVRLLIALLALAAATPATAAERAFLAIETADIAAAEKWYSAAFALKRINRFDRPRFDQRVLAGPDLVVELVQMRPATAKPATAVLGIVKAGVQIADFDRRLAAWRAAGIAPPKGLHFDRALGLASVQLTDPDGNLIQVFGTSAGPFDGTVEVDPAVTKAD
ncbi:VOC family protein [Sphingomonas mesophila]|uniref:VOC family protein n=1 Tax=Sphingomonas mesophila TaxID=2303576 RepID=UPI000E5789D8|nr:VOC family protein [Sphingomonas mesophila]